MERKILLLPLTVCVVTATILIVLGLASDMQAYELWKRQYAEEYARLHGGTAEGWLLVFDFLPYRDAHSDAIAMSAIAVGALWSLWLIGVVKVTRRKALATVTAALVLLGVAMVHVPTVKAEEAWIVPIVVALDEAS